MLIMPSFKKSLIVEQFRGNYLKTLYDSSTVDVQSRAMSEQEGLKTPRKNGCKLLIKRIGKNTACFFKNAVSEEPVFCICKCQQYTVLNKNDKIDKFNILKEQR